LYVGAAGCPVEGGAAPAPQAPIQADVQVRAEKVPERRCKRFWSRSASLFGRVQWWMPLRVRMWIASGEEVTLLTQELGVKSYRRDS
jgi:hypothetical protein